MKMLSKKIVNESHGQDSSYFLGWEEYEKNPYHQAQNPKGIIQMGLAENQLSFDLLESWLSDHPEALGLKDNTNTESLFKDLALFQDYHGLPTFKYVLAEFMSQIRGHKVKFDPNKLVLTAGSTSANETLMFCLADPGDAFLIPTPYYPGFDRDLKWRTGVEIVPIHCSSCNGFRITSSALEQAYESAELQGLRVRGVLVTNPSNPLGTTLDRDEINLLIDFAFTREIHLVSDEIYSGTAFDDASFISVAEALSDRGLVGSEVWARVHIVYSLSKDLGLPGFRVGMVYSNDADVVSAATKMSSFGLVSAQTQHTLSHVLSDIKFAGKYVRENRRRLRKRKDVLVSGLKSVGIKCLAGNACLFSWVDMRGLLTSDTFEAELELWKRIVYEVGINVSPGSSCHCSEPGWFRICFANMSEETLYVAIQRIRAFAESMRDEKLKQMRNGKLYSRTRSLPKWVFQLSSSFNDRRRENDR